MTRPKTEAQRKFYVESGARSYRNANKEHWRTAFFAAHIVGQFTRDATTGMAKDMSVSTSTIENHAHAYFMFYDLCQLENAGHYVRTARRLPYVHYSHFRALYDARNDFKLSNEQCMNLLIDIVQAEGEFSSRDIENLVKERLGESRDWFYYAQRTQKSLNELLKQPDLPSQPADTGTLYKVRMETTNGGYFEGYVVANNPQKAIEVYEAKIVNEFGGDQKAVDGLKQAAHVTTIGQVTIDSRKMLQDVFSWIGDQS